MAFTLRTHYSNVALGRLKATKGWLDSLNKNFDFPANVPAQNAGTVSVEMWDTFTAYTPTVGTLQTSGANNSIVSLTVGVKGVCVTRGEQQKAAMEFDRSAMEPMVEQAADALYLNLQDLVIAAIVAATPTYTATLATGYIDFALASAATNPDMITNTAAAVNYVLDRVRINNGGNQGLTIVGGVKAISNLKSIAGNIYAPSSLSVDADGTARWDGVPMYPILSATDLGGANNECLYIIGGRGVACKFDTPYPFWDGTGWGRRPEGVYAFDLMMPYAYGVASVNMLGSIINPAS